MSWSSPPPKKQKPGNHQIPLDAGCQQQPHQQLFFGAYPATCVIEGVSDKIRYNSASPMINKPSTSATSVDWTQQQGIYHTLPFYTSHEITAQNNNVISEQIHQNNNQYHQQMYMSNTQQNIGLPTLGYDNVHTAPNQPGLTITSDSLGLKLSLESLEPYIINQEASSFLNREFTNGYPLDPFSDNSLKAATGLGFNKDEEMGAPQVDYSYQTPNSTKLEQKNNSRFMDNDDAEAHDTREKLTQEGFLDDLDLHQVLNDHHTVFTPVSSNTSSSGSNLPKQFQTHTSRKRRKDLPTSIVSTSPSLHSNTSLNNLLLKRMTVDTYYDVLCAGHPFLPREELDMLPMSETHADNLAFLFSLQALCYQRFGFTKQGDDSFEKAKQLLSNLPKSADKFNTACTYCNLAMYSNTTGNVESAQRFSRALDYDMLRDSTFMDSYNPEQLKALKQMKKISDISGGVGYYGTEEGLSDLSKFMLSIYQYATCGDRPIPPEMLYISQKPLNLETLPEYLSLLDCVMKMMLIYETQGQHFSATQQKLTKYIYFIVTYGMKLLTLKFAGYTGIELEETAEKISNLSRSSLFSYAPTLLIEPVGLAFDVHLNMMKEVNSGERDNSQTAPLIRLLLKDVEAIKFLKTRFPTLCAKFETMIEESECLLEKYGGYLASFFDTGNVGSVIEEETRFIEGDVAESSTLKRKHDEESESSSDATHRFEPILDYNHFLPNSTQSTEEYRNLFSYEERKGHGD